MPHPLEEDRIPQPEPVRAVHKPTPTRARPLIFTLWLVGMIGFSLYAAYLWSAYMPDLRQQYSEVLVTGGLILLIVEVFAALGILLWKRWGIYGLIAVLGVNLILRLLTNTLDEASLVVLVIAGFMLWWVVRPNWEFYT